MATIRLQKYCSMPWPKGWSASGGRWLRWIPNRSRIWLPVSTTEWIPSEIIAELPVNPAATNLVAAIARFAASAP